MQIRLIGAMSERERGVGFQGAIPWKQKNDMQRFKEITTEDGIMVMGLNTFNSFNGYVLPKRIHIVLTSKYFISENENTVYVKNMDEAIRVGKDLIAAGKGKGISIIGGNRVWSEGVHFANELNLTHIKTEGIEFDVFFPEIDLSEWKEVKRESFERGEGNDFEYEFVDYVRI
jgi:dihydrofolate reductase